MIQTLKGIRYCRGELVGNLHQGTVDGEPDHRPLPIGLPDVDDNVKTKNSECASQFNDMSKNHGERGKGLSDEF